MGTSFVVSVYLQTVRGYNAIETGVIFTAATLGILVSSLAAERLAKRRPQRTLIMAGFVVTLVGLVLLLGLVRASDSIWAFVPGLLLIGLGVGTMLTPSVNVVQSSFPDELPSTLAAHVGPRLHLRDGDRHPRAPRHLAPAPSPSVSARARHALPPRVRALPPLRSQPPGSYRLSCPPQARLPS